MWLFDEACRDGVEDFLILSGACRAALHLLWLTCRCRAAPRCPADGVEEDLLILSCALRRAAPRLLCCCVGSTERAHRQPVDASSIQSAAHPVNQRINRSPHPTNQPTKRLNPSQPDQCAGDHLYRMDYREFVAAHRAAGADITVAALPCAEEQAQAFGLMKIDDRWVGGGGAACRAACRAPLPCCAEMLDSQQAAAMHGLIAGRAACRALLPCMAAVGLLGRGVSRHAGRLLCTGRLCWSSASRPG